MYKIIMKNWFGTCRDFLTGITTFKLAVEICENYHWLYDDGGYLWDLRIVEV